MDRRVLAVDRQDPGTGLLRQPHDERAGHHERFLVGQGHGLARLHRSPRAAQTRRADDGRNDAVNLGRPHEVVERLGANGQPRAGRQVSHSEAGGRRRVGHHHPVGPAGTGLFDEGLRAAIGGQQKRHEPALRRRDHLQRAHPHAPG